MFTHSLVHQSASIGAAVGEEGRERERCILGRELYILFELSLGIVLVVYIKEVFVGFSPP